MTLLVQLTDTHIVEPDSLLYGKVDTAKHLRESVEEVNAMSPQPDLVMISGDLVENPSKSSYANFASIIERLEAPVYLLPGNHDDPQLMKALFGSSRLFPVQHQTNQYVIEDFPVRILALNSHFEGSELPKFGPRRLQWLEETLAESDRPTLLAIHHPPMKTGVGFVDMVGEQWYAGIREAVKQNPQVQLIIAGHGHSDLIGRMGSVPVYMAGSTAHQLIAGRVHDRAPSFDPSRAPLVMHHWLGDSFVSGSNPWPQWVDNMRIDEESGVEWSELKDRMRGTMR